MSSPGWTPVVYSCCDEIVSGEERSSAEQLLWASLRIASDAIGVKATADIVGAWLDVETRVSGTQTGTITCTGPAGGGMKGVTRETGATRIGIVSINRDRGD